MSQNTKFHWSCFFNLPYFLSIKKKYIRAGVFCLHICNCTTSIPAEVKRGHQIPMELESQMVVRCHVVQGTQPRSCGRAGDALNH